MKKNWSFFYWPKGGNVESCAQRIADRFKNQFEVQIYSLDTIKGLDLPYYDLVIVGGSTSGADTWQKGSGDNLWFDFFSNV